jgi:hypothetical protein
MTLYKHSPHLYPMYNDLIRQSPECQFEGESYDENSTPQFHHSPRLIRNVNLRRLVHLVRQYDQTMHSHHRSHNGQQQQQHHHSNPLDYSIPHHQQYSSQLRRKAKSPYSSASMASSSSTVTVNVLNVTSVIFHESRCGSTLLTNIFTTMDMTRHRVYSEPRPILQAIQTICGEDYTVCSPDTAAAILRDTIYIMSRSSSSNNKKYNHSSARNVQQDETETGPETKVFFKFPSIASRNIPVFIKAFPNVPYILLYRNPMEVMVSHFHPTVKDSSSSSSNVKSVYSGSTFTKADMTAMSDTNDMLPSSSSLPPPLTIKCLTQRHSPGVSVVDVVQKYSQNYSVSATTLSDEMKVPVQAKRLNDCDYCAAHLASMTEMMVASVTSNAIVMNYRDVVTPHYLYTDLFPKLCLLIPNDHRNENTILTAKARIERMSSFYSKNRVDGNGHDHSRNSHRNDERNNTIFVTDTERKQQLISLEIRMAVTKYLLPSYIQLEELAEQQL